MGSKANFLENEILDHIVNGASWTSPGTVYSALFTIIPSDSTGGTEVTVTDSAYTRVATSFSTAGATATGQVANTAAVNFTTVAAGDSITIVGWALMTDSVTGHFDYAAGGRSGDVPRGEYHDHRGLIGVGCV